MPPILNRGNPKAPIWLVVHKPFDQDKDKGYIFSGGYGYIFAKMMSSAGIGEHEYYITSRCPDLDHPDTFRVIENELNHYKPPIILTDERTTTYFVASTKEKSRTKNSSAAIESSSYDKYSGSLLVADSGKLDYSHFIIPITPPDVIARDWSLRDVCVYLELGKAKSELDYFNTHRALAPLPEYELSYDYESKLDPTSFDRLLSVLDNLKSSRLLSVDIESVYPKAKSVIYGHPGEITTIGIANSGNAGISFRLFREHPIECRHLWRRLEELFKSAEFILGQNFFIFDAPRLRSLGFTIQASKIRDTLIRHHLLWPELPHKLQFQTKQYTRQPYYKDEGHHWNMKDMQRLKRYNCLDVCVTYQIYEAQEKEFDERPRLRA